MIKGAAKGALGALASVAMLALVAGCNPAPEPAASVDTDATASERHVYGIKDDVSGEYVPDQTVQVRNWRLKHVFISSPASFEVWAKGERASASAPVSFVFEDMDDPVQGAGSGAASGSGQERRTLTVVAAAYSFADDAVSIDAVSGGIGPIMFRGRIDLDALETSRRTLGHEGSVLAGQFTIGNQTFDNTRLKWWMGG